MLRRMLMRGVLSLGVAVIGVAGASAQMSGMKNDAARVRAVAVLFPTKGHSVFGVVRFEAVSNGVKVVGDLTGLAPGNHGFHIHEYGDCSAEDGTSAGGHFNPEGMPHSMPSSEKRHAGDLGNISADKDGNAHIEYVDSAIALSGEHSIIGRGVVVHEKEDDMKTQPTGAAGARIACGAVGIAK